MVKKSTRGVARNPRLLRLGDFLYRHQRLAQSHDAAADLPVPGEVTWGRGEPDGDGVEVLRYGAGTTDAQAADRLLEIAAAGGHNLLFCGPPGSGKSMMAARLPGILPPLTSQELLETSMVHSMAGLIARGELTRARPFRSPHHSASMAALTGGGLKAKPGEVSLAHNGVLFLDELPEFGGIMEHSHLAA